MIRTDLHRARRARPTSSTSRRPTALRRVLQASALAFAIGLSFQVSAQSITGGLYGTIKKANQGAVIVVTNPSTGFKRTLTANKNGQYNLTLLRPGTYVVTLKRDGTTVGTHTVLVNAGVSSVVPSFNVVKAEELSAVQVTANAAPTQINPIDVKTPTLKTVWNFHLTQQLPIPQQSIYAIPTLNSSVLTHDVQGLNLPVSRGAGPTANRYYYNEFDTTYDVTGVGAITFPQVAVANTTFMGSNSSLDFTSTTGGVVAATLRQGTNHFHAGAQAFWTFPTSRILNPRGHNTFYDLNGKKIRYLYTSSANHTAPSLQTYLWGSGAIVKNRLFFFAMVGDQPGGFRSTAYNSSQKNVSSSRSQSALLNLTWNITEKQSLNVAGYKAWRSSSNNEFDLAQAYTPSSASDVSNWSGSKSPVKMLVGNYHWYINSNMTLRLMAGYMRFDQTTNDANADQPYAFFYTRATGVNATLAHGPAYQPSKYYYAKRGYKGDFTWHLPDNTITLGAERYTVIYHFVPQTNPNGYFQYFDEPALAGQSIAATDGGLIPANGKYGYAFEFRGGGQFISHNYGYYLYDNWQVTPRIVIMGGDRLDQMTNFAANNQSYIRMTTQSPRLGVAWDVHGDSSLKIAADIGKFTLPLPSTVSYDNASAELYKLTYFSFTGINPSGTPIDPKTIGSPYEPSNGSVPRLSNIASQGIQNTYQYEFQLYAQQKLSRSWQLLADLNAATLKNLIDTTCDQTGYIGDYVRDHGHPNYVGLTGATGCIMFNPGQPITLRDDLDNTGKLSDITIPNSYLGYPAASRHYYGLTLKLSHVRSPGEPYFLSFSYTWAHLYGNSDGYVNVTKGSTSPSPGSSGNYQFPELTAGNYGDLGEDVRNNFVVAGVYYFPHGFYVGSVLRGHSGYPHSCLGVYPDASKTQLTAAGATTHYCLVGNAVKLVPAGSTWRAPFFWQLDLNLGYQLNLHNAGRLSINLSISNITNRNGVIDRAMGTDTATFDPVTGLPQSDPSYFTISQFQSTRFTELYLRYSF